MGRMPNILTGLCAALLLVGCNANQEYDGPTVGVQPHGSNSGRTPRFSKINRHRPASQAHQVSSQSFAGQSDANLDMFANAPVPGPATSTRSSIQPVKPLQPLPPVAQAADPIVTTEPIRADLNQQGRQHVVQRGDTLWSLANRYYSKPQRWRDILAANPGLQERRMAIGSTVVVP